MIPDAMASGSTGTPAGPAANAARTPVSGSPPVALLLANHRRFLAFLVRRVGSREIAEDILQEAFVRGLARMPGLRRGDSIVAWFYRLLRNALVDHYRSRGAEQRALERIAGGTTGVAPGGPADTVPDSELMGTVCACVTSLLDTLKPGYAAVVRRVDLEERSIRAFAEEAGITPNNAAVRLYRAREALRKALVRCCRTCATHGCADCRCQDRRGRTGGRGRRVATGRRSARC